MHKRIHIEFRRKEAQSYESFVNEAPHFNTEADNTETGRQAGRQRLPAKNAILVTEPAQTASDVVQDARLSHEENFLRVHVACVR